MPNLIDDEANGQPSEHELSLMAAEYERGHEAGYEEGRAAGLAEGQQREREALVPLRATLEAMTAEIDARQDEWLNNLEENLAALAVSIARQLMGRELREDHDAVADLVRRAVAKFPVGQDVTIRLNPEDLTTLTAAPAEAVAVPNEARWIADPMIEPGGCVVEGPDSVIDGRIDRALERVFRTLTGE